MDEGEGGVAVFRGGSRGREAARVRSWGAAAFAYVELQATEDGRPALLERLHFAGEGWETRPRRIVCGDGRRRRAREVRGREERWLLLHVSRIAGAGDWDSGSLRRVGASGDSRGMGIPRPCG